MFEFLKRKKKDFVLLRQEYPGKTYTTYRLVENANGINRTIVADFDPFLKDIVSCSLFEKMIKKGGEQMNIKELAANAGEVALFFMTKSKGSFKDEMKRILGGE